MLVSCTSIIFSIVTGLSYLLEFTNNINTVDGQQSYVKFTSIVWVTLTLVWDFSTTILAFKNKETIKYFFEATLATQKIFNRGCIFRKDICIFLFLVATSVLVFQSHELSFSESFIKKIFLMRFLTVSAVVPILYGVIFKTTLTSMKESLLLLIKSLEKDSSEAVVPKQDRTQALDETSKIYKIFTEMEAILTHLPNRSKTLSSMLFQESLWTKCWFSSHRWCSARTGFWK